MPGQCQRVLEGWRETLLTGTWEELAPQTRDSRGAGQNFLLLSDQVYEVPAIVVTENTTILQQWACGTLLACLEIGTEFSYYFEWRLYTQEAGYNNFLPSKGAGNTKWRRLTPLDRLTGEMRVDLSPSKTALEESVWAGWSWREAGRVSTAMLTDSQVQLGAWDTCSQMLGLSWQGADTGSKLGRTRQDWWPGGLPTSCLEWYS